MQCVLTLTNQVVKDVGIHSSAKVGGCLISARIAAAPVPVQIAGPAADLDGWMVEVNPASAFLRNVVLRGPADEIQRLRDREGGLGVIAFVHLTSDDLLQMIEEKPVTLWSLPAGVTVTSVDGDATSSPRIPVSILKRPSS